VKEIAISEFKAKCLSILAQVQKTHQPIRVTRHGKPVVEVVPSSEESSKKTWIGSMKDEIKIVGDIISPANDANEWEANRD
jgi:prevent-host-death family protein